MDWLWALILVVVLNVGMFAGLVVLIRAWHQARQAKEIQRAGMHGNGDRKPGR